MTLLMAIMETVSCYTRNSLKIQPSNIIHQFRIFLGSIAEICYIIINGIIFASVLLTGAIFTSGVIYMSNFLERHYYLIKFLVKTFLPARYC